VIRLHAALFLTGGKVGAGVAWRKSLDFTIGTIWEVILTLRSTYQDVAGRFVIVSVNINIEWFQIQLRLSFTFFYQHSQLITL
jgi:hypothetical protein